MRLIYADKELINGDDMALVRKKFLGEEDVKRMHVSMFVDTGAYNLCINESIQEQLQFPIVEKRKVKSGNDTILEMDVVDNVKVCFKNKAINCRAMVLSHDLDHLSMLFHKKIWMYLFIRNEKN